MRFILAADCPPGRLFHETHRTGDPANTRHQLIGSPKARELMTRPPPDPLRSHDSLTPGRSVVMLHLLSGEGSGSPLSCLLSGCDANMAKRCRSTP
jgi:hypothetical protein